MMRKGAASFQPPTHNARSAQSLPRSRKPLPRLANKCAPPAQPVVGGWKLAAPLRLSPNPPHTFLDHRDLCGDALPERKLGG